MPSRGHAAGRAGSGRGRPGLRPGRRRPGLSHLLPLRRGGRLRWALRVPTAAAPGWFHG